MESELLTFIRIGLCLVGIGLAFGYPFFLLRGGPLRKRVYTAVLVVCAASSFYTYVRLGPQFDNVRPEQIMNPHDFFHYYVGAKYHRELGYFDLYECAVVADSLTHRKLEPDWRIRDLRTYGYRKASAITDNPGHCVSRFSEERWNGFTSDVAFVSRSLSPEYWHHVLRDKGYNATPIWTAYASVLTRLAPLSNRAAFYGILSLDYLLVVLALVVVGLTFGWRNALLVTLFWGLNFMTVFGFSGGSVSRLDWLACLVIALCLIRRGRYAGAGALAAVATAFRIFPVLFLVGLAAKAAWSLLRTRRMPARYLRFLVGFALVVALVAGLTASTQHGRQVWQDFAQKITSHDEQVAGYRVGLRYALIDPQKPNVRAQWESNEPVRWALQALALLAVLFAAPRLRDHETLGLSFVCVVCLTAPTFYYYEMLVVPFMLFLPDPHRRGLSLGMGGFFAWCVLCYVLGSNWPLGLELSYRLSWTLIALGFFIVALVFAVFRRLESREPEPAPA
jgi:hypothetical protein